MQKKISLARFIRPSLRYSTSLSYFVSKSLVLFFLFEYVKSFLIGSSLNVITPFINLYAENDKFLLSK